MRSAFGTPAPPREPHNPHKPKKSRSNEPKVTALGINRPGVIGLLVFLNLLVFDVPLARAHPHVFIEARSELVFNAKGEAVSVRHIWRFDAAFSAFAVQGLDTDKDGEYSDAELKPLADININSLKEYDYFTFLRAGEKDIGFTDPKEYWLDHTDGLLTLLFTLPVKTPVAVKGMSVELQVYDPVYFVAFELVKDRPFVLVDAPVGCTMRTERATSPDVKIAAALSAIPATQRAIPKALKSVTETLTNSAWIKCP